jgi:hypothetical protein
MGLSQGKFADYPHRGAYHLLCKPCRSASNITRDESPGRSRSPIRRASSSAPRLRWGFCDRPHTGAVPATRAGLVGVGPVQKERDGEGWFVGVGIRRPHANQNALHAPYVATMMKLLP